MPKLLAAALGAIAALIAAPALGADVCIAPETTAPVTCPSAAAPPTHHEAVKLVAPPKPKIVEAPKPGNDSAAGLAKEVRRAQAKPKQLALLTFEISQLVEVIAITPKNSADRPSLLRRLADSYSLAEQMAFEDKIRAQTGKRDAEAKKAEQLEKAHRQGAIRTLTALKNDHPNWCLQGKTGCIDDVLYDLAYEYEQESNPDAARKVHLQLIKDHPASPHVPAAYLAFGELFFKEAQGDPTKWGLAEQAYKEVVKYPAPGNAQLGYAHYKLGYVHWNQGDLARALGDLRKAIEVAVQNPQAPGAKSLAESARRDLVTVYAGVGDGKKAYDFFKTSSGDGTGEFDKTRAMMDALGQALLDIGHYADAIAVYEDLQRRDHGPRACGYQAHVVEATLALKSSDKEAAASEIGKLLGIVDRIGRKSDAWKTCANEAAELTLETATAYHLEAVGSGGVRGTNDPKTMDRASALYGEAMTRFTAEDFKSFEFPKIVKEDWPTRAKIAYLRADLLYTRKDWDHCGPAFDAVIADDPKGALSAESYYASAVCYQNVYLATHDRAAARRGLARGADEKERALTDHEKAMEASFDRYLACAKPAANDKDAQSRWVEIAFARARTDFEARRFAAAAAGFKAIALDHAESDAGSAAAALYLESVNYLYAHGHEACLADLRRDTPAINGLYCKGDRAKDEAEACAGFAKVGRDIAWITAASLVKRGDAEHGAEAYLAIWNGGGASACESGGAGCERMDEVLENAALAYKEAHLLAKSMTVRGLLLDPRYHLERTRLGKRALHSIGATYQAIAVYDEAARYYDRYAHEAPGDEDAARDLEDAVLLYLGLGREESAVKAAAFFSKQFGGKQPALAAHIAFAIGAHQIEREDWVEAKRRLSQAMSAIDRDAALDVRVEAHAMLGRADAATGALSSAEGEYAKVRSLLRDAAAAKKSFDALGGDDQAKDRRLGKALMALGEAEYFAAEQKRRTAERIAFPAYHGSGARDDVLRFVDTQVKKWIEQKKPAIEAAEAEYRRVAQISPAPPKWVVESAARVGHLWGRFVAEFRAAPIPKEWLGSGPSTTPGVTWEEIRAAYWEALDRASEPFKQRAKVAFEVCLSESVKNRYFDASARSCETWLSKTYPREHHVVDEIQRPPSFLDRNRTLEPAALVAQPAAR